MNLDWIKQHRRSIMNACIATTALVILAVRFFLNSSPLSEPNEDNFYENWLQDPQSDEQTLQALLKSNLSPRHAAQIAHQLIMRGEGLKAEPFAQPSLQYLQGSLPEYGDFAQDALLISQGKLEEAFKKALVLKEKLKAQGKSETLLYGFNLVRLMSLSRALKNDESEISQELEKFLSSESEPSRLLSNLMTHD